MKHPIRPLLLCTLLFLFGACSDILEQDLSGYGVSLLTPPDNHITTSNVVQFRWEEVPGATSYRIQIATPDITNAVYYVVDSLVSTTTFTFPLSPGSYSWRARAENASSTTGYSERSLVVLESNTLDGLTPILLTPGNNAVLRSLSIAFTWSALAGAEDHRFELRSGSQTGPLVLAQLVEPTTLTVNDLAEGSYTWGVQGQNATSTSAFSYRALRVDRTPPSVPTLLLPAGNSSQANTTTTFQWQSGVDQASGSVDSLFILSASQELIRNVLTTSTSLTDSLGSGTFTWYVRTVDDAGNGTSSVIRNLTIE
jgi:hypothetical protein